MITTITLNAAIDKTYYLPAFEPGGIFRTDNVYACPGGKGLNVARVVRQLGCPVLASGFVGGSNGEFICRELDRQGIPHDFVRTDGESRLCLNIIDSASGISTEILEPGPVVTADQMEAMKRKVRELAAKSQIVAFSGSLPKGAPVHLYAELITLARREGAVVFLDASGDALLEGIRAVPDFIKPNETEVEKIIGRRLERESQLYDSVRQLMSGGIACVAVTLGASGSLVGMRDELYRVHAPKLEAVNTVGCGDAFVAGMAVAMARGEAPGEALRLATAAGSANALTERAGQIRIEDVDRFLGQIRIEKI
jgi:tagatose 6-phosphate kinase